ncbi:hypothetical protein Ais01nite_05770 [Asanoa ishikariensis]|uniref:Uncharacterized protein n=1 Tax=Asanoa ishikariensis TaxID=137265 RepID=A0A1H3TGU7_9ACTN|nr:hypothetical protein Ais01nite_05770 [Asanoa ishikariensis]SDZ48885.1 hypothetical protein SAMN05421684_5656 [Asanoa ishikariensis]
MVSRDGRRVTTLDAVVRDNSSGSFTLDGRRYSLPGAVWDTRFGVLDARNEVVAEATRVNRECWAISHAGQAYHLRRMSIWGTRHQLDAGDLPLGMAYRTGGADRAVELDVAGAPPLVEIFVLALVIAMRDAQAANKIGYRSGSLWW